MAALPPAASPEELAAAERLGLRRVRCVEGADTSAFCAGLVRPRVHVTTGVLAALAAAELEAVLAHEAAHARRRDPLRRLIAAAAADVCFYLPLARWWSRRQRENAELSADRAAIDHAGHPAVAAAMLSTAGTSAQPATGYDGFSAARIAQLLGDDVPVRLPTRSRDRLRPRPALAATEGLGRRSGWTIDTAST